eukprot:3434957-Rhodomonas_salina.7
MEIGSRSGEARGGTSEGSWSSPTEHCTHTPRTQSRETTFSEQFAWDTRGLAFDSHPPPCLQSAAFAVVCLALTRVALRA